MKKSKQHIGKAMEHVFLNKNSIKNLLLFVLFCFFSEKVYSLEVIDPSGIVRILIGHLEEGPKGLQLVSSSRSTGFFIDENGTLVTAFHNINRLKEPDKIVFIDPETHNPFTLEIVALDAIADLAILKAKHYKPQKVYPVKKINSQQNVLQNFVATGLPVSEKTFKTLKGQIANTYGMGDYFLGGTLEGVNWNDEMKFPGFSGGPVFFESGEVAGFLSWVALQYLKFSSVNNILRALNNKPLSCSSVSKCIESALDTLWEEGIKGNKEAQLMLGKLATHQNSLYKDLLARKSRRHISAFEWYKRSAEQDMVLAQFLVGDSYFYGKHGSVQRISSAIPWYELASWNNFGLAYYQLANIYMGFDIKQAIKYYQKAVALGVPKRSRFQMLKKILEFPNLVAPLQKAPQKWSKLIRNIKRVCSKAFEAR